MIRRRRRDREVAFGFDCFLDLVTNVVGIIIRLILVVWVGARSYSTLKEVPQPAGALEPGTHLSQPLEDHLQAEVDRQRRELADAQARLLEQLRLVQPLEGQQAQTQVELAALQARHKDLAQQCAALEKAAGEEGTETGAMTLSAGQLNERQKRLLEEIRNLELLPPVKKSLRYRTPVSRPVDAEEFFFECRGGRVAFVDIGTMLTEVRQEMDEKVKLLRSRWQVEDVTQPAGAFRLRYQVERQRGPLDGLASAPAGDGTFTYGLTDWHVEPITESRGETLSTAMLSGSEFRQVVDVLDPQLGAVTFWVYPDSFALFRTLRDYLYERNLTVAGRPLPFGYPIAGSRNGSRSLGQ